MLLLKDGRSEDAAARFVDLMATDYREADLPAADRAMIDYAIKLTRHPWDMTAADVDRLREHGFDDRVIHDICVVAAYFAFVNRIADGLGVELEPRFAEGSESRPTD
jgi:uncharacterized peroxidase-related enzyme